MRVLVTGGSGFIGRACVGSLRARGLDVIAPSSKELDVLDRNAVEHYLAAARPTRLVHAAWRAVRADIMTSPENTLWAKASLSLALAFHAHGGIRAAFLGTSAEYDWSEGILRAGVTTPKPATPYGAAKHALRLALEAQARPAGLSFVWPRIFFVYGPHDHPSRLGMAVFATLLADQPVDLSEGTQIRDYVYVDDVGEGVAAALMSDFDGATDLASGVPTTVRQLASEIGRQLGKEHLLRFGAKPTAPHETSRVLGDPAHARAHIGWSARTGLEQGVSRLIAWGRTNLRS